MKLRHAHQTTLPNDPAKDISATVWNTDDHNITEKIVNADIDDAAAIAETKLALDYATAKYNANKIQGKVVPAPVAGDDAKSLTYDHGTGEFIFVAKSSVGHDHSGVYEPAFTTLDGDKLPAMSATKKGGVPATGTPSGKYLDDSGSWSTPGAGPGAGVVPVGGIIMWSGTIATIPATWALCDGTANSPGPDLRDKFIVGASTDDAGVAKSNIEGTLKQSGGATGHSHSGHAALSHAGASVADHTGFTHGLTIANHADLSHAALTVPSMPAAIADHAVASLYHTHAAQTITHADHSLGSFSGTDAAFTLTHADHSLASFTGSHASLANATSPSYTGSVSSQAGVASFASGTNRSGIVSFATKSVSIASNTNISVPSGTHSHAASTITHADHSVPSASHTHPAQTVTHADHSLASYSGTHAAYTLTHSGSVDSKTISGPGDHKATDYGVHAATAPAAHGTAGTVSHSFTEPSDHSVSSHDTVLQLPNYYALAFIQRMS